MHGNLFFSLQVPMKNFNKDWNNGIAVGALVDAVAPGLFPQWEDKDPKDALENAREAMKLAEDWLGIPQVGLIIPMRCNCMPNSIILFFLLA